MTIAINNVKPFVGLNFFLLAINLATGNIKKMKKGVVIINCARGELVDNEDIIKAVNSGKVGRAGTKKDTFWID